MALGLELFAERNSVGPVVDLSAYAVHMPFISEVEPARSNPAQHLQEQHYYSSTI